MGYTMLAKRILLVEDDAMLRWELGEFLSFLGFDVIEAATGPDALRHLEHATDFDALVTDIELGGLVTGVDVARAFRTLAPGMPIVFASGSQPPRLAGSIHLPKPVRLQRLESALTRHASLAS